MAREKNLSLDYSEAEYALTEWEDVRPYAARLSSPAVVNNTALIFAILARSMGMRLTVIEQTAIAFEGVQAGLNIEMEGPMRRDGYKKVCWSVITILQIQDLLRSPDLLSKALKYIDRPLPPAFAKTSEGPRLLANDRR